MAALCAAFIVAIPAAAAPHFTLKWTDNSTNEDGFKIERSTGDGSGVWQQIGVVGQDVTSYLDDNLPGLVMFSYRVRAYNTAGNSGYSNIATGTTPAAQAPGDPGTLTIPGRVVNISTRQDAVSATAPLIGGFVIVDGPQTVLIRGIGPALAGLVPSPCADVKIQVMKGQAVVAANDDWSGQTVVDFTAQVGAFPLTAGSKDAAMVVTLPPGAYTVITSPSGTATGGTALVEVYWKP